MPEPEAVAGAERAQHEDRDSTEDVDVDDGVVLRGEDDGLHHQVHHETSDGAEALEHPSVRAIPMASSPNMKAQLVRVAPAIA